MRSGTRVFLVVRRARTHIYDLRRYLPPDEAAKVSDAQNPWQPCPCYDGLPLDTRRGPYPVIVFIHGTAGYAAQSAQLTAYWASQGFVVIAMDHPGIYLTDLLALNMAPRQADDVRELLADLRAFRGGFAELEGAVDLGASRSRVTARGYASGELGDEQGPVVDAHGGERHLGGGSHEPYFRGG